MLPGRGQQRSKLSSTGAAGSCRCLEPGVGALTPDALLGWAGGGWKAGSPWKVAPHALCGQFRVMGAVPRKGRQPSPRPPAGARGSRVDGDAGSCPAHPTSTPALVLAPRPVHAHTRAHCTHSRAHTFVHVQCSLTHTHSHCTHTHSSVWHSHTRTLLCAHTRVICALISHTCTASHAHTDMCSGTWPLPPPAQAQPTHSEQMLGPSHRGSPPPTRRCGHPQAIA